MLLRNRSTRLLRGTIDPVDLTLRTSLRVASRPCAQVCGFGQTAAPPPLSWTNIGASCEQCSASRGGGSADLNLRFCETVRVHTHQYTFLIPGAKRYLHVLTPGVVNTGYVRPLTRLPFPVARHFGVASRPCRSGLRDQTFGFTITSLYVCCLKRAGCVRNR